MTCRICAASTEPVLDLGSMPPANWLKATKDEQQDAFPLLVEWCRTCSNVQLSHTVPADLLYRDYLYTTPQSASLAAHYTVLLDYFAGRGMVDQSSFVLEMGSNVGNFLAVAAPHVGRVLGVDPATEIVATANERGVRTIADFFTPDVARQIIETDGTANLVLARHSLAHNESPHSMVEAARIALAEDGYLVIENAYVLDTVERGEFDQIYHEHMFYFSVTSMAALLALHDFSLVDVMLADVHGGSIVFVAQRGSRAAGPRVETQRSREAGVLTADGFATFARRAPDPGRSHRSRERSPRRRSLDLQLRRDGERQHIAELRGAHECADRA